MVPWTEKELYEYGTVLLRRGRNFEKAIVALQRLTERVSNNREYQLALASACASRFASLTKARRQAQLYQQTQETYEQRRKEWETAQNNPQSPFSPAEATEKAVMALRTALKYRSTNFDVLYQLAIVTATIDSEVSIVWLEKATRVQGTNAFLWYFRAEQQFRQAENKGKDRAEERRFVAIPSVQKGNAAPVYTAVPLTLPVPTQLKAAWAYYRPLSLGEDARLLSALFSWLSMAADKFKDRQELRFLETTKTMLIMGTRAASTVNLLDLQGRDLETQATQQTRALMGIANGYRAYELVKQEYQRQPSPRKKQFLEEMTPIVEELKKLDSSITGVN